MPKQFLHGADVISSITVQQARQQLILAPHRSRNKQKRVENEEALS
jgi:hypothetical protein